MKNLKKHLLGLFPLAMLFLFHAAQAQPTCFANFNPAEACQRNIQEKELIFLGRVVALEGKSPGYFIEPLKIVVEVETAVKGTPPRRVELFLKTKCAGEIVEDERYIFTADRAIEEGVPKLYSESWSAPLGEEYSADEIARILDEIRALVNKIKQPRLAGRVIQQNWSPEGRYLMRANALNRKLGYEAAYARPLEGVVVTARRRDDGREVKVATDADGKYAFDELPPGKYEVFTNLPSEFDVHAEGLFRISENDKESVEIGDWICSRKVNFNAQLQGEVRLRIGNVPRGWERIDLHLLRVVQQDGRTEFVETASGSPAEKTFSADKSTYSFEHAFKNLPVGPYAVTFRIVGDPSKPERIFYFPGTSEREKADVIEVEAGKTRNLELDFYGLEEPGMISPQAFFYFDALRPGFDREGPAERGK
ncbi:MAG TPA: carboxypeptidase-like regulatory domain-containing protein [Pyrinomonadaceae bacterium]|jgi:hypothetical protein